MENCAKFVHKPGVPFRSVETPVAKSPLEATAREPPRSTTESWDES